MKTFLISLCSALFCASALFAAEESFSLIEGQQVRVLYFEPDGDNPAPPLAVLIAGGSNNDFMARAQFWMGKEMVSRGWAIAVPISPGGREYFTDNAAHFPRLISDLRQAHQLKPGKTLLVGISSGGSAALSIAARNPEQYLGVIAAPGRLQGDAQLGTLSGLPVYLRVGEKDDFFWNRHLDEIIAELESAGAAVDAAVVPDARHVFALDWEQLEPWLLRVQATPALER